MKKFLTLSALLTIFMLFQSQTVHARRGAIVYSTGPTTQSLHKFAEPVEVEGDSQTYTDFGIVFEQFSILGVPIWNYGQEPTYALYSETSTTITSLEFTPDELAYMVEEFDIPGEFSAEPSLSFWNKIGGKLVVLAVFGALVAFYALRGGNDDEE